MSGLVYFLAAVGGFCLLCSAVVALAIAADWVTDLIRDRRQPPSMADCDCDTPDDDRAFLTLHGIDPNRLAWRPYDHEREGL